MREKLQDECNIYKVTNALIDTSPKGFEIFKIQLNGTTWVSKLVPTRRVDKLFDKLHKFYAEHNNTLKPLIGKYISLTIEETKFGGKITTIHSLDAIDDFEVLLDKSGRSPFYTKMNIYEFLKKRGRDVCHNETITLNPPYEFISIVSNNNLTIGFYNEAGPDTLNLENIQLIYERFYKDRYIETHNNDRSAEYGLGPTAIAECITKYHKSKSKIESSHSIDVLKLGDPLTPEQIDYINSLQVS